MGKDIYQEVWKWALIRQEDSRVQNEKAFNGSRQLDERMGCPDHICTGYHKQTSHYPTTFSLCYHHLFEANCNFYSTFLSTVDVFSIRRWAEHVMCSPYVWSYHILFQMVIGLYHTAFDGVIDKSPCERQDNGIKKVVCVGVWVWGRYNDFQAEDISYHHQGNNLHMGLRCIVCFDLIL